jgi:hypothetical protein
MEPTCDLRRLGHPAAHSIRVRSVTFTADDPDAGMGREPGRDRIGGAHGEDIDDAVAVPDRPGSCRNIAAPLFARPSAQHTERRIGVATGAPRLTRHTMVSAAMVMPNRANRRSPARPPRA